MTAASLNEEPELAFTLCLPPLKRVHNSLADLPSTCTVGHSDQAG